MLSFSVQTIPQTNGNRVVVDLDGPGMDKLLKILERLKASEGDEAELTTYFGKELSEKTPRGKDAVTEVWIDFSPE